jgi:hypothetical protein
MTPTVGQLPHTHTKLRYHSTAHCPYTDNDKDYCDLVWVDHWVDHNSALTSAMTREILCIASVK